MAEPDPEDDWELGVLALAILGCIALFLNVFRPWEPALPGGGVSVLRIVGGGLVALALGSTIGMILGIGLAFTIQGTGLVVREVLRRVGRLRAKPKSRPRRSPH